MNKIRVVIAEDQPVARDLLIELLSEERGVDVIATCHDGQQAVSAIESLRPDLVFLDIEMPELDGLSVVERVGATRMPVVIFVTAYDEYALKAFEVHAIDYLLKPFGKTRLQRALAHARAYLDREQAHELAGKLLTLVHHLRPTQPAVERFMIRSHGRVVFVSLEQIDWVEAEGNYVRLHVGQESHLLRETMAGMEAKLGSEQFCRIHRGRIVALDRVRELRVTTDGEYEVVLRDGSRLGLGRHYRNQLCERLRRGQ